MSERRADENFLIIRLDGRDFHILAEELSVNKPFDLAFALSLVEASKTIFHYSPRPLLAYAISDEVNFVFSEKPSPESLSSVDPTLMKRFSEAFHNAIQPRLPRKPAHFDWDVWRTDRSGILSYVTERQEWAYTNSLKAYAFWLKAASGLSPIQARESLSDLDSPALLELLSQSGLAPENLPLWQHRGIIVSRRRGSSFLDQKPDDSPELYVDLKVPLFKTSYGSKYILNLLNEGHAWLHGAAPRVDS